MSDIRPAPEKPAAPPARLPAANNVTININFPKLHLPLSRLKKLPKIKPRLPTWRYKLILKRLAGIGVVLACGLIVYGVVSHIESKSGKKVTADSSTAKAAVPSFTTAVPKNRPELANAANNPKAAYDSNKGVYSFQDTLLGTTLIVSEQALPANFSSAEQAVAQIAKSAGARDVINTGGVPAYMKTEASNGSQTIVTSVKGLLIFIQSPFRHSADDWKIYLQTLN
jgi:hypothetical protein